MTDMEGRYVSKYMTFQRRAPRLRAAKTGIWDVTNNQSGDLLAKICWFGPWRKYCALFEEGAVFDDSCLREIAGFLMTLNHAHRSRKDVGR